MNDDIYFRSVVAVIPWMNPDVAALQAQYSTTNLPYPAAITFDEVTDELFLVRSGINDVSWISVYAFPAMTLKRTFTLGYHLGEGIVVRRAGTTRYLYATQHSSGPVLRANITTLPANLSTVTPTTLGASFYTQMAFDGTTFAVQVNRTYKGAGRRNIFELWDADFTSKKGDIYFPMGVTGDFNTLMEEMPKSQSICVHDGRYIFGCGGDWVSGYHNPDDAYCHPGIRVCDPHGNVVNSGLCRPDKFLALLNPHLATGNGNMTENEGVASYKGSVYALWMNRSPATASGFPGQGFVLTKEFSQETNRIDFRSAARLVPQLDLISFENRIHQSSAQLTNPVTGAPLGTFKSICEMMTKLGMSRYAFNGAGQTLVDINGNAVNVGAFLVEFRNLNGSTFVVDITSLYSGDNRSYWIYSNYTLQVDRSTPSRWIVPGAGNPEGVVASPVGTLFLRTNGGIGSTLYVKESGTGKTGWVAK